MALTDIISKVWLTVINIALWFASVALMALGVFALIEYFKFNSVTDDLKGILIPVFALVIAGVLLFLLGVVGCCATFSDQKCLKGLFFTLLLFIFVGLVGGAVTAYVFRHKVDTGLHDIMKKLLNQYGEDGSVTNDVDLMQQEFKCCGVDNYTDWTDTPWHTKHPNESYPTSCCKDKRCTYLMSLDVQLYKEGCYSSMKSKFLKSLVIISIVTASVAIVLLFGMLFICVQMCRRRREVPYIGLQDADGQRV